MATDPQANPLRYETQDANPRGLFLFMVCIAVFLVIMSLLVAWLFGHYVKYDIARPFISQPFENARPLPPPPVLQAAPVLDIQQYLQSQQNILNSYGWVDRQQGLVRVPIDRAMELLLQRGFPTRPQQDAPAGVASGGASGSAQSRPEAAEREVQP